MEIKQHNLNGNDELALCIVMNLFPLPLSLYQVIICLFGLCPKSILELSSHSFQNEKRADKSMSKKRSSYGGLVSPDRLIKVSNECKSNF